MPKLGKNNEQQNKSIVFLALFAVFQYFKAILHYEVLPAGLPSCLREIQGRQENSRTSRFSS